MSTTAAPKNRKLLEREVESKRKDVERLMAYIKPDEEECIRVLVEKKTKKEEEINNCYWFQYLAKFIIRNEISSIQWRIRELKSLEKSQIELMELEQQLYEYHGQGWGGYPGSLDDKVVAEYRAKFMTLSYPLTPNVPRMNIIMIGETGAGKSSLLRTFVNALTDSPDIKDIYRVSPLQSNESATQRIHLERIYVGEERHELPCRFYDMPGLDEINTIKKEEIQKILNGELKIHVKMPKDSKEALERKNPTPKDVVHCILYVIKANANLSEKTQSKKIMKDFIKEHNTEDGVRQFVIVTAIDEIGVPNFDMKKAYSYHCVRTHCKEVSHEFNIDLLHVIPVSNYFEEVVPNDAKNAMSLFNFWRIFKSGKEYIERQWNKQDSNDDFGRLIMRDK